MKLFTAIVALSGMATASASLRGTDGILPTGMTDLLQDKKICKGPKSGGLQAACDPSGFVSEFCKSGYFCEPIIGDPNQKGQCIKGGGLQAACDPADLGAGCQCGNYCEEIIGDPNQNGQCIPGGGLRAPCDPDTGFGCQAGFDCERILGNTNQNGQCIPRPPPEPTPGTRVGQGCGGQQMPDCGNGKIAMCCPPSYKKAKKGFGSKYLCVNSSGVQAQCPNNPAPEPTPGTRVGQGCGGQQMPDCGKGKIAMCCPPSKKKAKKGFGSKYLCVNSSGGMQAECPSNNEFDFSELVTEW